MTAPDLASLADRVGLAFATTCKHKMARKVVENDPYMRTFPAWAHKVGIATFRDQGWSAHLQPSGKRVAGGAWGTCLTLDGDGKFGSDDPDDSCNAAALRARAAS